MDKEIDTPEVEEVIEEETPEDELSPETDWEAEAKKARGIAQRLRTKLTKATEKKVVVEPTKPQSKEVQKTGELDNAVLDFFDLKGYDDDQIKVFTTIMEKTGMSHREVIKDEYALAKADAIKQEKAVKDATPSTTKRGGGTQGTDLAAAIVRYEQSGYKELPKDFALRSAVVNAIAEKTNPNKPSWHN